MATVTVRNGVDVDALLETIDAIKTRPELAGFTFRASTTWREGTHSTARIGSFLHASAEDESRQAGAVDAGVAAGELAVVDTGIVFVAPVVGGR